MQLPRGTFREIKKKTKFGGLLDELQQTRFTGICTISFGAINGIIVFKSGKRILAEYQDIAGDSAWDAFQKIVDENVGAALSTLDEAQIQLSLEFNKSCRIVKVGKPESSPVPSPPSIQPQPSNKSPPAPQKSAEELPIRIYQRPGLPDWATSTQPVPGESQRPPDLSKKTGTSPPTKAPHKPSAAIPRQSPLHTQKPDATETLKDEIPVHADSNTSSFEKDIDTFENMDVEAMTDKIRGECKTIIKQLQLEHLIER